MFRRTGRLVVQSLGPIGGPKRAGSHGIPSLHPPSLPPHPGSARLSGSSPLPCRRPRATRSRTHRRVYRSVFMHGALTPWAPCCNAAPLSSPLTSPSILNINISSSAGLWIRKLSQRPSYIYTYINIYIYILYTLQQDPQDL